MHLVSHGGLQCNWVGEVCQGSKNISWRNSFHHFLLLWESNWSVSSVVSLIRSRCLQRMTVTSAVNCTLYTPSPDCRTPHLLSCQLAPLCNCLVNHLKVWMNNWGGWVVRWEETLWAGGTGTSWAPPACPVSGSVWEISRHGRTVSAHPQYDEFICYDSHTEGRERLARSPGSESKYVWWDWCVLATHNTKVTLAPRKIVNS